MTLNTHDECKAVLTRLSQCTQLHDAFGHEEEALLDSALGALASLAANQRRHQVRATFTYTKKKDKALTIPI